MREYRALTKMEQQQLEAHAAWLKDPAQGKQLDWSNADLSRTNLDMVDLSQARLTNVNLSHASLIYADLSKATMAGANLSDADLVSARLDEAYLPRASLCGANLWKASLNKTCLSEANLWKANLTQASLIGASLSRANLFQANLYRANLGMAFIANAELPQANFRWTNLRGADLRGSFGAGVDFSPTRVIQVGPTGSRQELLLLMQHPYRPFAHRDQGHVEVLVGSFHGSVEHFAMMLWNDPDMNDSDRQDYIAVMQFLRGMGWCVPNLAKNSPIESCGGDGNKCKRYGRYLP